jgi:hypothetical protein
LLIGTTLPVKFFRCNPNVILRHWE